MTHTALRPVSSHLRAVAAAVAFVVIAALLTAVAPIRAEAAVSPVQINETVGPGGFAHPGIGMSADNLRTAQAAVAAGTEPWASYYAAMTQSRFASKTYVGDNVMDVDQPKSVAFKEVFMRYRSNNDSIGAMTQTFMYIMTGDETYRANAIKTLRAWSKLDPQQYGYFADAHIHTPLPIYQFLVAADILRSTTPANPTFQGYDVVWSDTDDDRFEANFVRPHIATFLNTPNRYLNQHNYGTIGAIAAGIYYDDKTLFDQRVEWFSVNSTFTGEGDWNGSLAALFREIPADHPQNIYGETYVQHQEMGRDQAHAWGDVVNFAQIARMLEVQGTKLDPVAGTVTSAANGVSAYKFLDNRILTGANEFDAFMMGEDVKWVDVSGGPGALSQAYRGRLFDPMTELYYQYKYVAGVDVATEAPAVARAYEQREGPLFWNGVTKENFAEQVAYQGGEYWLAFPQQLATANVTVPPLTEKPEVSAAERGVALGSGATVVGSGNSAVLTLDAGAGNAKAAVRQMVWGARTGSSLVAVRVKTAGSVTLEASRTAGEVPYASVELPDTNGQWRYVTWDIGLDKLPAAAVGENILFLNARGGGAVAIDQVLAQASSRVSPASFRDGDRLVTVAVAGEAFNRTFSLKVADATLGADRLPSGASIAADGRVSWTPTSQQQGKNAFVVVADDGESATTLPVEVFVAADRSAAIDKLAEARKAGTTYTSASLAVWDKALADARAAAPSASASALEDLLEKLRIAGQGLEILSPTLADGTLSFPSIVTSPDLPRSTLASLIDGDNQSFWGDLRIPSVAFDFGAAYRVSADRFGFLARNTFTNRAQGSNVYGSNDGTTWVKLTERVNAGSDNEIEYIPVIADLRDDKFRFLKIQVDEPGVPSDPAYPGIWSLSEFRIDGQRVETVGTVNTVTLAAPGSLKGRVVPGSSVSLAFSSPTTISDVAVAIGGSAVTATTDDGKSWKATSTLPASAPNGTPLTFTIDYKTATGQRADTVSATTDSSLLYSSTDDGLIDSSLAATKVIGLDGRRSETNAGHATRILDKNVTTFSDLLTTDGRASIEWDLGAGGSVNVTAADILVRQDQFGLERLNVLRLEGSNDRQTWTPLTLPVKATLDWQRLGGVNSTAFRYLRLTNGNIINVAEARIFGTYTAPVTSVKTLTLSSSNTLGAYAVTGDTVTVNIETTETVSGATASIDGKNVPVQSAGANKLQATAIIDAGTRTGVDVPFTFDYRTPAGQQAATVSQTSDDSYVRIGTNEKLITDLQARSTRVNPDGSNDTSTVANPQNLFDGKATTHTDARAINGSANIIWDLGADEQIALERAEILMRQDQFGTSRISNLQLQGSNDRVSWTTLARDVKPTLVWQSLPLVSAALAGEPFRYLRLTNGNIINVAELRLYGGVSFIPTAAAPTSLETVAGTPATLPATVRVTLSDGSQVDRAVVWDDVAAEKWNTPGTFSVAGALRGTTIKAAVDVTIKPLDAAQSAPGKAIISHNNGWDNGLQDGSYDVKLNLWWGETASKFRLYEGDTLVTELPLTYAGIGAQEATFSVTGKPNGSYTYTGVLVNSVGSTKTDPMTVKVTDANPATPVLSHDNWDDDGNYILTANLWWGSNATSYRFLRGTQVVGEGTLTASTPNAQTATLTVTAAPAGAAVYSVEFINAAGSTKSAPITVKTK